MNDAKQIIIASRDFIEWTLDFEELTNGQIMQHYKVNNFYDWSLETAYHIIIKEKQLQDSDELFNLYLELVDDPTIDFDDIVNSMVNFK